MRILGCIAFAVISTSAAAQVHRCIDSSGKATYSDVPCPSAAKRAERVLGREATESTDDPYAAQRTMESIQRARELQQGTVNSAVQQSQGSGGAVSMVSPRAATRPRPDPAEAEGCETISNRQGCIGGERARNPNWSPRRGYYGGGGPADQKYEADRERREAAAAQAQRNTPVTLTNCNAGGCWDTSGNRYNRTGNGQTFVRGDGKFCRAQGNTISCN